MQILLPLYFKICNIPKILVYFYPLYRDIIQVLYLSKFVFYILNMYIVE